MRAPLPTVTGPTGRVVVERIGGIKHRLRFIGKSIFEGELERRSATGGEQLNFQSREDEADLGNPTRRLGVAHERLDSQSRDLIGFRSGSGDSIVNFEPLVTVPSASTSVTSLPLSSLKVCKRKCVLPVDWAWSIGRFRQLGMTLGEWLHLVMKLLSQAATSAVRRRCARGKSFESSGTLSRGTSSSTSVSSVSLKIAMNW